MTRLSEFDSMFDAGTLPPAKVPKNMIWIPPGTLLMGSEEFYPEETPVHPRDLPGFWIDVHPVTNAEFRRFVRATGYITTAESAPAAADYPDASDEQLVRGSLVFTPPNGPVSLDDFLAWWSWVPGAHWRHPDGPATTLHGKELHPVTHVSLQDAMAFADWVGKDLPTESEWEYAARGGLVGARFAWGNEETVGGRIMANTWHGQFPHQNFAPDGYARTSPVGAFPANGYGMVDACGNVWEWTKDDYTPNHGGVAVAQQEMHSCCGPGDRTSLPAPSPAGTTPLRYVNKVIKGGSHLCSPNYCLRYRPAARQTQTADSSTSHLGFRCVMRTAG